MSKKKSNGYGSGTFIETAMFLSQAFISLGVPGTSPVASAASVKILIMLLGKRQFDRVKDKKGNPKEKPIRTDDNKFTLTYKELGQHGIAQRNATRGIDELLAKGFVTIVDPGGAFEKHKAVYALSDDYLLWNLTHKQVFNRRERDIKRGYQKRNASL